MPCKGWAEAPHTAHRQPEMKPLLSFITYCNNQQGLLKQPVPNIYIYVKIVIFVVELFIETNKPIGYLNKLEKLLKHTNNFIETETNKVIGLFQ